MFLWYWNYVYNSIGTRAVFFWAYPTTLWERRKSLSIMIKGTSVCSLPIVGGRWCDGLVKDNEWGRTFISRHHDLRTAFTCITLIVGISKNPCLCLVYIIKSIFLAYQLIQFPVFGLRFDEAYVNKWSWQAGLWLLHVMIFIYHN